MFVKFPYVIIEFLILLMLFGYTWKCIHVHSAHALPVAYRGLMTDPNSSILDFYPTGKSWEYVHRIKFLTAKFYNVFIIFIVKNSRLTWMGRDLHGRYCCICKKHTWLLGCWIFLVMLFLNFVKGLCKLPFIEEDRLIAETSKLANELKV